MGLQEHRKAKGSAGAVEVGNGNSRPVAVGFYTKKQNFLPSFLKVEVCQILTPPATLIRHAFFRTSHLFSGYFRYKESHNNGIENSKAMRIRRTAAALMLYFCSVHPVFGQSEAYSALVRQADSLFRHGEYQAAAHKFSESFAELGWRGYPEHRFTAARAWARAAMPDSAVSQLQKLMDKTDFLENKKDWMLEGDFTEIQTTFVWQRLMTKWQMKLDNAEKIRTNPLTLELEKIHRLDQYYRVTRDSVIALHGLKSPEMKDWIRRLMEQDSLNFLRVNEILEQYGWLGADQVSEKASTALWLVLQHADTNLEGQEKWLPVMRDAVRQGKAKASNLAYLEDRVLKNQGKPQRYGSQMYTDPVTQEFTMYPVEDPQNLDARRKSVGLGPIKDYLEQMGATWNPKNKGLKR